MDAAHYTSIHDLEKRIDRIKMLNKLGRMPHQKAKLQIKELEIELRIMVDKLPDYDRNVYRIKKEFGKDF